MEQRFASLLRFMILGLAAAAHHYALTPPPPSSQQERDLIEGAAKETKGDVTDGSDNGPEKEDTGVLHEKNVRLLQLGLNLCNWSRYAVWGEVALEGVARILSIFPASKLSTAFLPVLLPSFSSLHLQSFPAGTTGPFFTLISGPNRTFLLSAAVVIAGAAIRHACFNTLQRFYTFSHTTLSGHTLVKTGLYAIVRHPGYLGTVLVRSGMIYLLFSAGSLAGAAGAASLHASPLLPWTSESAGGVFSSALRISLGLYAGYAISEQIWLCSRSWREDETLHKKFGLEWEEYRNKVPWRFIPFIF